MPAALPRISRQNQEMLPPGIAATVTTTYLMKVDDHLIRFAAGGAYTITLPPVFEAKGGFYLLRCVSGTSTVTVVDAGDARLAVSDTLNADNEVMMVYSDGEMWHFIITPPA
jgi:hypothetical protein